MHNQVLRLGWKQNQQLSSNQFLAFQESMQYIKETATKGICENLCTRIAKNEKQKKIKNVKLLRRNRIIKSVIKHGGPVKSIKDEHWFGGNERSTLISKRVLLSYQDQHQWK